MSESDDEDDQKFVNDLRNLNNSFKNYQKMKKGNEVGSYLVNGFA